MMRFTIAGIMATILCIGIGFAALRSPKPWLLESAVITITTSLMAATTLTAFADNGQGKMAWTGFSVFGWSYIITNYMIDPSWGGSVPLMTYVIKEIANEFKDRMAIPYLRFDTFLAVGHSLLTILFGLVGALLGQALADRNRAARG